MKTLIILFYFACLTKYTNAQPDHLDSSFGKNGIQRTSHNFNRLFESPVKVLTLKEGGFFEVITLEESSYLAKYSMNGILDSSYGENGFSELARFKCCDATLDAKGRIIVVGVKDYIFSTTRFLASGFIDKSYGYDGILPVSIGRPDNVMGYPFVGIVNNEIIVIGSTQNARAEYHYNFEIIRIGDNGQLIATAQAKFRDWSVVDAVIFQENSMLVGGVFSTQLPESSCALATIYPDGSYSSPEDLSFISGGYISALVMQEGKIVVGVNSGKQYIIARCYSGSSPDYSFGTDGKVTTPLPVNEVGVPYSNRLAIQGDKIIASGRFESTIMTIMLNPDGSPDKNFNDDGIAYTSKDFPFVYYPVMTVQNDKIIVAFYAQYQADGKSTNGTATIEYNLHGNLDSGFAKNGIRVDFYPSSSLSAYDMIVQPDGKIIVAGYVYLGIKDDNGDFIIMRFNRDGSPDTSFGNNGIQTTDFGYLSGEAKAVALQGDKIIVSGNCMNQSGLTKSKIALARYNPDGSLDNTFGTGGKQVSALGDELNLYVNAMTIQSGKIIVVGYSIDTAHEYSFAIARFNSDGSPDLSFDKDGLVTLQLSRNYDNRAAAVAIEGDKIVVAGYSVFKEPVNQPRFAVIRLNDDGSPDNSFDGDGKLTTSFDAYSEAYCTSLLIQENKIIATGYGYGKSKQGWAVAHYNQDGSLDLSFSGDGLITNEFPTSGIEGSFAIKSAITDENGKILVIGKEEIWLGASAFVLARYNTDGSIDSSFGNNGFQKTMVNNYKAYPEKIYPDQNRLYAVGNLYLNGYHSEAMIVAYQLDEKITLSCPQDTTTNTGKGSCSALMNGIDPVFTGGTPSSYFYSITGATTLNGKGTASGNSFNKGESVVTYSVSDDAVCHFNVMIVDKEAPLISNISASQDVLWPPNNKMKDVIISYTTSDNCGSVTSGLSVTDNDNNSNSKKGKSPLWEIIDSIHVRLLAEKSKDKNTRIYTITISATDADGNISRQQVQVKVPHAEPQTKNKTVINDNSNDLSILATPNPSQQDFTLKISSNNNQVISLVMLDASGRLIEAIQKINPNTSLILGSKYNPGIYYAELRQGNHKKIIKLVKL